MNYSKTLMGALSCRDMLTIATSVLLVNPFYVCAMLDECYTMVIYACLCRSTTSALLRLAVAMLGVDAKTKLRAYRDYEHKKMASYDCFSIYSIGWSYYDTMSCKATLCLSSRLGAEHVRYWHCNVFNYAGFLRSHMHVYYECYAKSIYRRCGGYAIYDVDAN